MPYVLDASIALAWLLPDEASKEADALATRLTDDHAAVPAIWPLEIGNALLTAERRGRLSRKERERGLEALSALPIFIESPANLSSLAGVITIAADHNLSVYDASYLFLAKERALPLATVDQRMRKACVALRIPVLP
jgi:predicted nucleic acid-binding protein